MEELKTKKKQVWYNNGVINKKFDFDVVPPIEFTKGRIIDKEKEKIALEKRIKTMQERYGVDNIMHSVKYKNKIINTSLQKYGTNYPCQAECVKNNIKKAINARYNVDNVFQLKEIKQKSAKTKLQKYGYENTFQNKEILTKAIKHSTTTAAIKKRHRTMINKYGTKTIAGAVYRGNSKPNVEFKTLLEQHNITDIQKEFYLDGKYYDFRVNNLLIEIDPTATHNSTWSLYSDSAGIDKNYHYTKTSIAQKNNYHCIHIFDWDDEQKIIEVFLTKKEKIYARKCEVKIPTKDEVNLFILQHHIQKNARYQIAYGLYYNNILVSVMTFGKPRYNKNYEYELIRYCSSKNIIGGAKKLFSKFIQDYTPKTVISYCDNSKFNGKVYEILGFTKISLNINKHWYNIKTHKHITNNLLIKHGFDRLLGNEYGVYGKGTSNEDLMKQHGFVEIWDAGQSTFVWKSSKTNI